MVAPIVRWSRELWATHTRASPHSLPWHELRSAWTRVFEGKVPSWSSVGRQLAAMVLSLARIRWCMPSFVELQDDLLQYADYCFQTMSEGA